MKKLHIGISAAFAIGIAAGVVFATQGISLVSTAVAKDSGRGEPLISPTEARERNFYAPNSETLKPDEMRVIACGIGVRFNY